MRFKSSEDERIDLLREFWKGMNWLLFIGLIALLTSCSTATPQQNTTTGTTTTILQCPNITATTTTIQQFPNQASGNEDLIKNLTLKLQRLNETIHDLRGFAQNGYLMANTTINETASINWNASNKTGYSVRKEDIKRLAKIRTMSEGMQHSFRNIMGW